MVRFAFLALVAIVISGCISRQTLLDNGLRLGYQNRYMIALEGKHILDVIERGVGFVEVSTVLDDMNIYYLANSCRSWGTGAVTTTYRVYLDGYKQVASRHVDYYSACNHISLRTDKDGVITHYNEFGSEVMVLPEQIKTQLADLLK